MLSQRLDWLGAAGSEVSVRAGLRGIEKETLRVDVHGRLAQTPHPPGCGSPLTHPHITTDYSEALLELVTPPVAGNWQTLQELFDIHAFSINGDLSLVGIDGQLRTVPRHQISQEHLKYHQSLCTL